MYTLYDFLPSGNGYKVRLLLNQLGISYELVEKDIVKGETRTPEFLNLNSNGRIPLLQLENGECLAESNAILMYLAEGTPFLPDEKLLKARVLQWMFFEQYSHEPNIAVVRYWMTHGGPDEEQQRQLPSKMQSGYAALDVMEKQLSQSDFLVGGKYSVADIALYAYTHVAHEGNFDLSGYPAINAWLLRVQSRPNHLLITDRK
ncbi:glutathione S-transferase family protein [Sneathiella glossodoripedis]|uniref:glutathione S-transferase family protein n=1 Tax=Sneathiella glossodoripedis TaxID=418853 RepID=UPI000472761B|nr:glutathione S-transferase family protein [Sneathiella glossodoripedis]